LQDPHKKGGKETKLKVKGNKIRGDFTGRDFTPPQSARLKRKPSREKI